MPRRHDTIVIGAGIAGSSIAYYLQKRGVDVLLVDRSSVAGSGGSGAAGAFVSPKIGRGSPLQELTNQAFVFAKDFYIDNFPKFFHQTGIVRIPKDIDDDAKFSSYEPHNYTNYSTVDANRLQEWGIDEEFRSFLFEEAGVCDAPKLCRAISSSIEFKQFGVDGLRYDGGEWIVSSGSRDLRADRVVLSTGYQNDLVDMRYMGVRATWGSRGDYYSDLSLPITMHKSISISANIGGIIKVGATHVKSTSPCMVCDGRPLDSLMQSASDLVNIDDFQLKETYCGMRSGSKDYFPLVGRVVDTTTMLDRYPNITKGAKVPLIHYKNLYISNGFGGRGFVFAPMMGKILSDHIVDGIEIDSRVDPDRLFLRWCRREMRR